MDTAILRQQISQIAEELVKEAALNERHLMVIGASTSEVIGNASVQQAIMRWLLQSLWD